MNKEAIERPWEDCFCDRCVWLTKEDMCVANTYMVSFGYCPQIRNCREFKEAHEGNEQTD